MTDPAGARDTTLVVGVDAGGTGTRAVVATVAGAVAGRGAGGPGNPISAGPAAVAEIAGAVRQALSGSDPSAVGAGVLGVAGTSVFVDPSIRSAFDEAWRALGLRCPMRFAGDMITAFAAGTPAPSGTVLIAGTGAVAARIAGHEIVRRTDGLGWLLGDEGSGRWIGLQTLRFAVRNWSSPLASGVARHTGAASADALIRWAQQLPLPSIGALAPLVCTAARAGDPDAAAIVAAAVDHLLSTLDDARAGTDANRAGGGPAGDGPAGDGPAGDGPADAGAADDGPADEGPVVLAGSLLTGDTPVRDGVLAGLRERAVTARTGRDPAAAAAWLAARDLGALDPAGLHARLLG